MIRKEMISMLLAGGQGSRLGVLTSEVAKPAVAFGGKYRIIDFPLSNCVNSGIDTVGVLTQYQPLRLNAHIGIGIPWDLDRNHGGVTVLPPQRDFCADFCRNTQHLQYNAIHQDFVSPFRQLSSLQLCENAVNVGFIGPGKIATDFPQLFIFDLS